MPMKLSLTLLRETEYNVSGEALKSAAVFVYRLPFPDWSE
jgi:hypothetical protein